MIVFFYCFAQAQVVNQFPWTEGFEGETFPSQGWTVLDIDGEKTWTKGTIHTHSGTGSAFHDWATPQQTTALVTPQIQLPNYGEAVLDFWSRFQLIGYKHCSVMISTTVNNNINAFTEVKVLAGDETTIAAWKNITVSLQNYAGQNIYIAFLYENYDGPQWYIDDVTITHLGSFVDIQTLSLSPKTADYAVLHNNDPIKVKLKNNGGNAATGFGLQLWHNGSLINTETFTSSIPSLEEAEFTFNTTIDLTTAGQHTIKVVAQITGDQVPENDEVTSILNHLGCSVINTFPFFEGFENNGLSLPSCWTQEYLNGDCDWRVMDAAYANGIPGIEPKTAFEGNYKVVFYDIGEATRLSMPPLNLLGLTNPVLKFQHIQQRYVNDIDSLIVLYKTSLWVDWAILEKYTDMVQEWTERVIPLPNPSPEYYIAFDGYGEYGHSIQLDNVTAGSFFNKDIAVQAITPSGVHVGLSDQQVVTTTIKNNGSSAVSGISLSLFLNESFVATEVLPGSISGLGEATYSFNAKVDLSVSGNYTLKVVAELAGDDVPENNELTVNVKNLVCDALTYPYEEGFEEEVFPPYCWLNVGTQWEKMNYDPHSGLSRARHKWWDGAQDGWLISPKYSIPAGGNFAFEFWSHVYDAAYYTYSGIWISTTNTNISSFTEIHELTYDERPEAVWIKLEFSLNAYAGQNVYVAFRYKTNGGQSGHIWSLDDIKVLNLDTFIDAEVMDITSPTSLEINLTDAEPVTAKIKNNGGDPLSNFQLQLEHNGAVVATENYTGFIPSLASANYTFTKKLDLSAEGNHTIKVTVIAAGDMEPINDSKTKIVENRVCPPITSFPWKGEFQGEEAGSMAHCWVNLDENNDTKKWWSMENNGVYYAISESYDVMYEFELTPDNWLITPPLKLMSGETTLSFKIGSANSSESGAENYSVLVSNEGVNPIHFTTIFTEKLNPLTYTEFLSGSLSGYGVKNVNLSLADFVGETVHIAFRHWDCTAQDRLLLSDIEINSKISITENSNNVSPLFGYVQNNTLYIGGLFVGEEFSVYSMMGQLVYQSVAQNETERVTLNTHGLYVVRAGNRVVKAVR